MDELVADFLVETNESLDNLDTQLVTLEQNPNDQELLGSIFRIMHTIKGTCGFLGLPRLESVAHAGENIMDKIRAGKIQATSDVVSMIFESLDKIKDLVNYLEEKGVEPEGDDKELISKLNKAIDGSVSKEEGSEEEDVDFVPVPADNIVSSAFLEKEAKQEVLKDINDKVSGKEEIISKESKKQLTNQASEDIQENKVKINHQQSIRVSLDVLENLMQIVGELVLNRNQLLQLDRSTKENKFTGPIQRLSHITSDLQEGVMKTRMQPISNAWNKFPRMVRDLARDLNKKVNLQMLGEETELDRQLIESIKDPLTHMIRNSVDHGIETPEKRLEQGKSEEGSITLKAFHQGGHIIIEIDDDGIGVNIEKVTKKILENNLATEQELALLSEKQIIQFIFKAGFSTADAITSISGRGVGMDVVKNNIKKISGTVELKSVTGKGSSFIIKIPLTLAIMPILIVDSAGEKFGIPQINVIKMCRCGKASGYEIEEINGKQVIRIKETLLPLISLSEVLELNNIEKTSEIISPSNDNKQSKFVVICEVSGRTFGVIVDKIHDTEEIVVKPVAPILKIIGMYSGNTILGNGRVIMILDPIGLLNYVGDLDSISDDFVNSKSLPTSLNLENKVSLLMLQSGEKNFKVVPLEIVSRLEEIDSSSIEFSGGKKVVQYRGGLMYLTELNKDFKYPESGMIEVVVFMDNEKILGLVVDKIIDIVEQNIDSDNALENSDFNVMVVKGKTMDVVNISRLFDTMFTDHSLSKEKELCRNGKRILYIDDSPFFRKFVPPAIINAGYEVTTVENADKAINLLEKNDGKGFDLIISDINMPGMSGLEFAEYCKNDERFSHLPIIGLTSSNEEKKKNQALTKGMVNCLSKTNQEELLTVITNILDGLKGVA